MLSIAELNRRGVSSGEWKRLFNKPWTNYDPKIKKLVEMDSARIRDGRTLNLREWRAYAAIDLAEDVPFNQTTPTLVQHILSRRLDFDGTKKALDDWGLGMDELFIKDPKSDALFLNPPVFFGIFVPLVKAYRTARLAKIFNERNVSPLLPYIPRKQTERDAVLCEIITDQTETQAGWYGYSATMKQAILQTLKYGQLLAFPREEWHCEKQLDDQGKKFTVKEGLRYILPDPTRMFYDLKYPLTSLNTDSGTDFCGHWTILTYGDILDNPNYWNRRSIFSGTNWFQFPAVGNYFSEVFPCTPKFPVQTWGESKREDRAAWYQTSDRDQAVFITEMFSKIVPRDWGLGDYKYPIWRRTTYAGDDSVIWSEPCAYTPAWFMGYDWDENAGRNSSLSLELIPWQDYLGNILSQIIITAKQNLANLHFYEKNMVDANSVNDIISSPFKLINRLNMVPYDSQKWGRQSLDPRAAVVPVQLQKFSMSELQQLIPTMLGIMERVLQISAQEAGAAASHQQGKSEVQQTGAATTNRVAFTSSGIDEGIDAWKRQLYQANHAYRDPEFEAQVSIDIPNVREVIQQLGFETVHEGDDKILVKVHKDKIRLRLEDFARIGEGAPKSNDKEVAQVMFQVIGTIAGQEDLHKKIGAKNLLSLIERGAILAGAPVDFRLRLVQDDGKDDQVPANIMEAIQGAMKAVMQGIEQKVAQPAAQEVAKVQGEVSQLQGVIKQLEGNYKIAGAAQQKVQIQQQETAAEIQRKQLESVAEQKRLDIESQAKIARDNAEAQAKLAIESAKAGHATAKAEQKAASDIEIAQRKADALKEKA